MGENPYEPPVASDTGDNLRPVYDKRDAIADPALAYTANDNLELHTVVMWLHSAGVRAYAVEDNSGASLYVFGTISQFHKPQVYVDKADLEEAGELLRQFADCDFEDAETESKTPGNVDDEIDAAKKLDQTGDWDSAIAAYRTVSDRCRPTQDRWNSMKNWTVRLPSTNLCVLQ